MMSKGFTVLFLVLVCAVALSMCEWNAFKNEHSKYYFNSDEELAHYRAFEEHKHHIDAHNLHYDNGVASYKMGLNKYSDLRLEEFNEKLSGRKPEKDGKDDKSTLFVAPNDFELPGSVDWRQNGAVTEVKDQKHCGASWAISATGAVESQYFLKTGHLMSLSDQNLIDCSGLYGNHGCEGGLPEQAFKYIRHHGIFSAKDYPYDDQTNDHCIISMKHAKKSNVTVHGYTRISSGNENDLQTALAIHGPISVLINAGHRSFMHYSEGIWHEPYCSSDDDDINHSVLLVGYDTDEHDRDYYILKNSFGTSWGENGYFRMPRNADNHCGIATDAVFPNI